MCTDYCCRRLHLSPLFLHVSARPVCLDQGAVGCPAMLALLETGHALSLQHPRATVDLYLAAAKDWEIARLTEGNQDSGGIQNAASRSILSPSSSTLLTKHVYDVLRQCIK
jgi:hypothetical protein